MAIPLSWADGDEASSARESSPPSERPWRPAVVLPHAVESAVWRGDALGTPVTSTLRTGFDRLDAELPGGGWPASL